MFGKIENGQMQLGEAGKIVEAVWMGLPQFYEDIESDAFVVMPNHVHGIVVIRPDVGAIPELALRANRELQAGSARIVDRRRMLLPKMIGRFKMVSAKQINGLRKTSGRPVWQRNYFEHIVRDDESLNRIRQYIVDNPAQWEFDSENPAVIAFNRTID
jgi:REP element-mobilizing transposase RayT